MKRLSDRHIKTPLKCEIEHSVKIDLTFTAYWSLPCAMARFLDNCFIIGFTYFSCCYSDFLWGGCDFWKLLTAERSRLASQGASGLGVLPPVAPWTETRESEGWFWGGRWGGRHPGLRRGTLPTSQGGERRERWVHTIVNNGRSGLPTSHVI